MKLLPLLVTLVLLVNMLMFSNAQQPPAGSPQGIDRNIGVLHGKVIDSLSSLPLEYSNIILFRKADSSMVNGTITGKDGTFRIEKIPVGRYYAIIRFIGFEDYLIPELMFTFRNPEIALGSIIIQPTATALRGIEITTERDMMISNLDKRVINVDKDLTGVGGTAVDIMQNIPSVTVDVEGNVKLRGSSNVLLLIDGRPTGLEGINSADILQQIPANTIESIEVITNPSVRHDPDGNTGIINIVLKRRSLEGLSAMVSLNAGNGGRYNGNVNVNMRTEKFNISAAFDGRLNQSTNTSASIRETTFENITTVLNQNGSYDDLSEGYHGNISVDFLPNRFNTIGLQVRYRGHTSSEDGINHNINTLPNGFLLRSFDRHVEEVRKVRSFNYVLNYRRTTQRKGEELTADLMFWDNSMQRDEFVTQENLQPMNFLQGQESEMRNTNVQAVAQLNYIRPVGTESRIETGFKSQIRMMDLSAYYRWDGPTQQPDQQDRRGYDEQIHAVYGLFGGQSGKFRYQAGLRLEQAFIDGIQKDTGDDFHKSYFSYYPSLHLVYTFNQLHDLQLSYSRRVDRPHNRHLNPFVDYSDSLNIRSGNPELLPEFSGSWDLSFVTRKNRNSLTASVFYRRTTDIIQMVSRLHAQGITWTRPENLSSGQNYGVELILNGEVSQWMRVNANASYFRQIVHAVPEFAIEKTDNYTWNAKLSAQLTLMPGSTLQISGNYNAPTIMAQGRMEEMYFADLAYRHEFMNRAASVSLRVSDIFDSRQFNSEMFGPGFRTVSERKRDTRVFWIGVTYRFNNYQRTRERNRQIDGMDVDDF